MYRRTNEGVPFWSWEGTQSEKIIYGRLVTFREGGKINRTSLSKPRNTNEEAPDCIWGFPRGRNNSPTISVTFPIRIRETLEGEKAADSAKNDIDLVGVSNNIDPFPCYNGGNTSALRGSSAVAMFPVDINSNK